MWLQIAGFKTHICRLPVEESDTGVNSELTVYRYIIKYIPGPAALELGSNYQVFFYHRHLALRTAFEKL